MVLINFFPLQSTAAYDANWRLDSVLKRKSGFGFSIDHLIRSKQ